MHAQFDYSFTDRLAITEVTCLYLAQTNTDARLSAVGISGL